VLGLWGVQDLGPGDFSQYLVCSADLEQLSLVEATSLVGLPLQLD